MAITKHHSSQTFEGRFKEWQREGFASEEGSKKVRAVVAVEVAALVAFSPPPRLSPSTRHMANAHQSTPTKIRGIRHIVRLKGMIHKWRSLALNPNSDDNVVESEKPSASDHKKTSNVVESLVAPPDVPKGYLAVYVGPEHRRFVIPTSFLGLPVFKVLLLKAEEEFGFDQAGGLTLPCEIETFKYILQATDHQGTTSQRPSH